MKTVQAAILTSSMVCLAMPISTAIAAPANDLECTRCVGTNDLEGNAITSGKIKDGEIKTTDIENKAITSAKIDELAVKASKIANNAITTAKIKADAITTAKIKDRAITNEKIKNGSVTSEKIQNEAVVGGKIANGAVGQSKLTSSLSAKIDQLDTLIASVGTLLEYIKIDADADYPTILIEGANLQITNGQGHTVKNGTGNLIVGYNADVPTSSSVPLSCSDGTSMSFEQCFDAGGVWSQTHRTGSHNIVVGRYNSYSNYGGILGGEYNTIHSKASSITSGTLNLVSENYTNISGGSQNTAGGSFSSILGGRNKTTGVDYSTSYMP